MTNLYRKFIAIDKLMFKFLLVDIQFNIILLITGAFLLGVCIHKHSLLILLFFTVSTLGMALILYRSITLAQRQKKLMDELSKEYKKIIKKFKSYNNCSQWNVNSKRKCNRVFSMKQKLPTIIVDLVGGECQSVI